MQARKLSALPERPFQLSLSVRHPSIDPAEISRELQLAADESFAAGQPRKSRSGMAATSLHGETYWVAALEPGFGWSGWVGEQLPGRSNDPQVVDEIVRTLTEMIGPAARRGAHSASVAVLLSCGHLLFRHGAFLRRLHAEGGTLCLVVTLSNEALSTFRITPELGRMLSELGITVDLEFTGA
ncbi:MAG: hypothetical protein ACRETK_08185 [Steroidobacteraceae bacterium]